MVKQEQGNGYDNDCSKENNGSRTLLLFTFVAYNTWKNKNEIDADNNNNTESNEEI